MDDTPTNWTGVMFGFLTAVISAFHQMKVPPVLPEMLAAYDYDKLVAGGFMSVYAVTGIAVALALGGRMQRQGIIAFFYAGILLILAGSFCALAWPESGWLVLVGRGLEGVGAGVLAIAGPTYCTRNASPRHLPIAAGMTAAWVPIGALAAAGLAFAAANGDPASGAQWRSVWWGGIAGTCALAAWTVWLHLRGRVDLQAIAAPAPLEETTNTSSPSAKQRATQQMALYLAAGVFLLWSWGLMGFLTWLPERMVSLLGESGQGAALTYAIPFVFVAIFNLVAAAILRRGVSVIGLLIVALVGPAVFLFLMPMVGGGWPGGLMLAAYGAFVGMIPTVLYSLPTYIFGRAQAGPRAFSVLMIGRNLGGIIGPLSVAGMVRLGTEWSTTVAVLTAIQLTAAVVALILGRKMALLARR